MRAAAGVGQRPGRLQGQGRREKGKPQSIDEGSDPVLSIISRNPPFLTTHRNKQWNVFACDLKNEPHGDACWVRKQPVEWRTTAG